MKGQRTAILGVVLIGGFAAGGLGAEPDPAGEATARVPFNVRQRRLWTSENLRGTPEPPDPYTTEAAFPRLQFFEPLSVGVIPGSGRFGVATRPGRIYTFENRPDVARADLLIDIGKTTYGVAFHPRFAENRSFYVTYVLDAQKTEPNGSRLSRFEASRADPPVADPKTERILLEWPSGGHNGGCIRFGPEGDLYLATGDGSGIADELATGQDLGDLLGSILRIDVDRPDGGRPYTVPKDNPFVGTPGARGEIWSFGHRQVWKFGFDRPGRLWAGEEGMAVGDGRPAFEEAAVLALAYHRAGDRPQARAGLRRLVGGDPAEPPTEGWWLAAARRLLGRAALRAVLDGDFPADPFHP